MTAKRNRKPKRNRSTGRFVAKTVKAKKAREFDMDHQPDFVWPSGSFARDTRTRWQRFCDFFKGKT